MQDALVRAFSRPLRTPRRQRPRRTCGSSSRTGSSTSLAARHRGGAPPLCWDMAGTFPTRPQGVALRADLASALGILSQAACLPGLVLLRGPIDPAGGASAELRRGHRQATSPRCQVRAPRTAFRRWERGRDEEETVPVTEDNLRSALRDLADQAGPATFTAGPLVRRAARLCARFTTVAVCCGLAIAAAAVTVPAAMGTPAQPSGGLARPAHQEPGFAGYKWRVVAIDHDESKRPSRRATLSICCSRRMGSSAPTTRSTTTAEPTARSPAASRPVAPTPRWSGTRERTRSCCFRSTPYLPSTPLPGKLSR